MTKCMTCNGFGYLEDPADPDADDDGYVECPTCHGFGDHEPPPDEP